MVKITNSVFVVKDFNTLLLFPVLKLFGICKKVQIVKNLEEVVQVFIKVVVIFIEVYIRVSRIIN